MKFQVIPILFVGISLVLVPQVTFGQSITELNGNWSVVQGTLAGTPVPNDALNSMSLSFTDGNFQAKSGSLQSGGSIAVAVAGTTQLNFTINSGNDAGKTIKALYRLENGSLTITFSQDDQVPSSHNSTAANNYCSLVYRAGGALATLPSNPTPPIETGAGAGGSAGSAASIE